MLWRTELVLPKVTHQHLYGEDVKVAFHDVVEAKLLTDQGIGDRIDIQFGRHVQGPVSLNLVYINYINVQWPVRG